MLVVAEALLATAVWAFFTTFPLGALYGALQAAVFYLVLAMAMATLFRGEGSGRDGHGTGARIQLPFG